MAYALAGIAITAISALIALLLVKRYAKEQPTAVKAVFFGLYFWGLVFLFTMLYGIGYGIVGKSSF
jgi:uncharacterized membrane protein